MSESNFLSRITVLILTRNEEANIERTLAGLSWASRIIVLDSESTDRTVALAQTFSKVQVLQRGFDSHAQQCNFGLEQIQSDWTLILDADYVCPPEFGEELSTLNESHQGYEVGFHYACFDRVLRGTLYPPRTVLFRTKQSHFIQDGHTQRVVVDGSIGKLKSKIVHDDRKPLSRWVHSQYGYASLEADKILIRAGRTIGWKDRLRRIPFLAPLLTVVYCLVVKGLILDGKAGIYYTAQRVFAELLLSMELLDRQLRQDCKEPSPSDSQR